MEEETVEIISGSKKIVGSLISVDGGNILGFISKKPDIEGCYNRLCRSVHIYQNNDWDEIDGCDSEVDAYSILCNYINNNPDEDYNVQDNPLAH